MTAFFEMDVGVSNWVGINILMLCLHPGLVGTTRGRQLKLHSSGSSAF